MAEAIFDLCTFFGTPSAEGGTGIASLITLLDRHRVSNAATLSTRALHYAAGEGNRETATACAAEPRLAPAFVLDPRTPAAAALHVPEGAALLGFFPATQNWPTDYAPVRGMLRSLAARASIPLLWEARRPGDATAVLSLVQDTGYTGPILLSGVSGEATLTEAVAVARESDAVYITTNGLRGIGEVAYVVGALGAGRVVFGSGAPVCSLGAALALIRHAGLTEEDRRQVLGENARRLLKNQSALGNPT